MEWGFIDAINYWDVPDHTRDYLEGELIRLIKFVEGTELPSDYFKDHSRAEIIKELKFYDEVAFK